MSNLIDEIVDEKLTAPAEQAIKTAQRQAEREAANAGKAQMEAIKGGVAAKIVTVIE